MLLLAHLTHDRRPPVACRRRVLLAVVVDLLGEIGGEITRAK